jgi:hypothetical protein
MRLLTSTTIFLAALTLASAAYAQDGARAYDPNQLPSYRGQVQFFTLTPPGDIDAPPGPKGQLRAPSPPAPSADAGPRRPLADRMQALRLHLRRGPAIRLTMRPAAFSTSGRAQTASASAAAVAGGAFPLRSR